jgi:hypothetical protein
MEVFALQAVRFLKASPEPITNLFPYLETFDKVGTCESSVRNKLRSMKMFLFSAALVLAASSTSHATEALFFNGGGYTIELLIGFLDAPVIAQVRFTAPEAKEPVTIPRKLLRVEKFDMKKRILDMHFSNRNDPDLPASFSLSANKTTAVLSIGGKKIQSDFDWDI